MGGPEMARQTPRTLVVSRQTRATPRKEPAMRIRVMLAAILVVLAATADAKPIAGAASLSGTVQAPAALQAVQVHLMNTDKNVLFMVWTSGGRYQAVNLFPGRYEVSVRTAGFAADPQTIVLEAGQAKTLDFAL